MSNFKMRNRPKKPNTDGSLKYDLWNGVTIPDVIIAVESFMKKHPFLSKADVSIEYDYDNDYGGGMTLQAAGKPYAVCQKELEHYKKELKVYNDWRADNREEIIKHKEAEKKRIAKNKLQRLKERLSKEMDVVEAKLANE